MTFIGGLNQFSAIRNLKLTQHLLKKKVKIKCIYSLYAGYLEYKKGNLMESIF